MKTYEAHVTGVIGRTVTVQAENKEAAESKAIQEFKSLTGVEDEVGIDDIEDVTQALSLIASTQTTLAHGSNVRFIA